jgi:nucleoside-diphosphate-sugar epimerase
MAEPGPRPIRKVLITGAAGYLAGFIIDRLRLRYSLTLFDRIEPEPARGDLPLIPGDITDAAEVEQACAGQDAVVHLVALVRERFDKPPPLFADVMVKGTWNVAEACVRQGVGRLVNVSSIVACGGSVFGEAREAAYRVGEPSEFRAGDLSYCLAKRLGEQIGDAYHQAYGLSVVHLRPGVIAGDGRNVDPVAPERPDRPWFVHVDPRDVAQAVECTLATEVEHGCFQIVAGRPDALFDWTEAVQALGYRPEHNWPEIPIAQGRIDHE